MAAVAAAAAGAYTVVPVEVGDNRLVLVQAESDRGYHNLMQTHVAKASEEAQSIGGSRGFVRLGAHGHEAEQHTV